MNDSAGVEDFIIRPANILSTGVQTESILRSLNPVKHRFLNPKYRHGGFLPNRQQNDLNDLTRSFP